LIIKKQDLKDIDVAGKKVLMRVDFNVPLDGQQVRDDTRIKATLPTINLLLSRGARLVLVSHLGRPKGEFREELRMDPVAARLSDLLGRKVRKLDYVAGPEVEEAVSKMQDGEIMLLENVRFAKGEEQNDPKFARLLAEPFDLFVNDAFGTAHRAHASTVGVAEQIPAISGLLMKREIEELSRCLEKPLRPLTAVLGGAKVSDKIGVVSRFLQLADTLLIGGGMANTFLAAEGLNMGSSFYEQEQLANAANLIEQSKKSDCRLLLPVDLVVTKTLEAGSEHKNVDVSAVDDDWKAVDIGPETASLFSSIVRDSKLIVWNGPLGVFEIPPFEQGTETIARAIADSNAYSIIGGGDLVAAIESLELSNHFSFISTGGGATLEFWEGKELPGLAMLQ
jgi:phosphoglycerate kinase